MTSLRTLLRRWPTDVVVLVGFVLLVACAALVYTAILAWRIL